MYYTRSSTNAVSQFHIDSGRSPFIRSRRYASYETRIHKTINIIDVSSMRYMLVARIYCCRCRTLQIYPFRVPVRVRVS